MFDSLQPHGLCLIRCLCPWDCPGKNTETDCHFLLQRIFQTLGSNPCLASPALAGGSFSTSTTWEALNMTVQFISVQFSSVSQLCPTLCNLMDCSTPGFPVHHQLQEFTQTHVHRIGDAIQPSHPLLFPFPAFSLSQHQGLFQ